MPVSTTTTSETPSTINTARFYPCYLDMDKIKATTAFGWRGIYQSRADIERTDGLYKYLLTVQSLTDVFSPDKLNELATFFMQNAGIIRSIQEFATYYLSPTPVTRPNLPNDGYNEQHYFELWENKVLEIYERYLMSKSLYDRVCYDQFLNDLLWNSMFDPRDPRIVDMNLKRISDLKNSTKVMAEAGIGNVFDRLKVKFDPRKYKFDIGQDGSILITKNYQADLFRYFANSNRLMKMYKRQMKLDELKSELAKVFFINELIESKYIYNQLLNDEEKRDFKKFSDLRANILSTFKTYLEFILSEEDGFDFMQYYEASPYAKVLEVKREQIKGIRNLLSMLLT
jgi:hypothetical protein